MYRCLIVITRRRAGGRAPGGAGGAGRGAAGAAGQAGADRGPWKCFGENLDPQRSGSVKKVGRFGKPEETLQ